MNNLGFAPTKHNSAPSYGGKNHWYHRICVVTLQKPYFYVEKKILAFLFTLFCSNESRKSRATSRCFFSVPVLVMLSFRSRPKNLELRRTSSCSSLPVNNIRKSTISAKSRKSSDPKGMNLRLCLKYTSFKESWSDLLCMK